MNLNDQLPVGASGLAGGVGLAGSGLFTGSVFTTGSGLFTGSGLAGGVWSVVPNVEGVLLPSVVVVDEVLICLSIFPSGVLKVAS